ncbi:MAG: nitroreductase [Candidatus Muproteobacteria bacterium RIFCSPHIGHO2_12_FULL_60_33]|uniref:Nitroreductase n=1 Tax=Candidatus Muproteobacteria bacterium RIFCSPLOWO2_01_FULL_60_18 TaxID=1817768 RepID=A0A1F6U400_9PROT|nr:MAG: nitroreductase [Candidatus Muproteobacteria bacterium RIFCSPHIGHO2_01_60_12]OGI52105.1 MAG: nitroreductase [Candidatus Muproteobacteria bacterium RIFCSPLOWO2_01_FULL_60_18]OGI53672.1 MAG: nitroreductase [Candidatus Muproteobacteria bacterium RIFCSPHIGHO2_02_FULL_60_13]OGI55354.1 MAG: nitroreductase [Candidatus Muproteobacteria bacterium RIFCSPHIGHO2_12_FULL_60_33]OGI59387.1 MAG: nitroreductase [Candidatus Muproteobacteria bacterium RIFCSPHIGHO2_01_FULL_61_200]
MEVLEAIHRRASTRAYLDKPVDRATVEAILDAARWAPSGTNAQPWQVVVVTSETKQKISTALLAERIAGRPENPDYAYYPKQWNEPYKSRRVACGLALYRAMKIGRDDKDARLKAWNNNYSFFGAPVGLLFFLDRSLEKGSWVDMGMFIENVMLAALGHGLATCPQASIAEYPDIVRTILNVLHTRALVCGMSLGYPDPQAPVNNYRTAREPVANFTTWHE